MALTCDVVRDLAPAYVLGALDADEQQAVADHLRTCPEAHEEMAELGGVVPYLAETLPQVEPPAGLRARILAAAADDLAARRSSAGGADMTVGQARPHAAPVDERLADRRSRAKPATPPISLPTVVSLDAARSRRAGLGARLLGLAAVLAIVALGSLNVLTQQELSAARSYQERLTAALVQAGRSGSQVAHLGSTAGPGTGPTGIVVMPAMGPGTLVVSGLAATTGSQVYEAWAIVEGQAPTPVGGFTVGSDGIGYFDNMPSASSETLTIAITLEPAPNPVAPSSTPIAAGVAAPPGSAG